MVSMESVKAKYPDAEVFTFGDSPELCDRLLWLVRNGQKTATCGALRAFGTSGEPLPVIGRHDISVDWSGRPALVIETLEVTLSRFCDIAEAFALAEGENDTLESWRADHQSYFERNGGFDPEMELVCERFKLVEDFA